MTKIAVLTEIVNSHSGARAPLEIARHLSKLGHQITVYAYDFWQDQNTKAGLKKDGVSIVMIKKPNIPFVGKYLASISLFKILKKHSPKIMTFSGTPPFFLAGKLTGIPIVRIYQGIQFDAFLEKKVPGEKLSPWELILNKIVNIYIYLIDLMSFRLSTGVVAVSNFAAEEGKKLYKRKVDAVIYNGTTILPGGKSTSKKKRGFVEILSVSRITPYKGFHLIIAAIKKVKTDKKVVFTIVGSQPKENYFNYLKKLGGENLQIILDPSDAELGKLYQRADFYANADRYLYFGLPICEAAFFGKPTVSLDLAAAGELIVHGETGFVAQNQKKFSNYIEKLVNEPQLVEKMGKAAKVSVTKLFIWEKTALEYNRFLTQILDKS